MMIRNAFLTGFAVDVASKINVLIFRDSTVRKTNET